APDKSSVSTRVRPSASRNILPWVSTGAQLPSGKSRLDALNTSAEKGAPATACRLIPADKVLAETEFVFPLPWPKDGEALNRRVQQTTTHAAFMISPGRMAILYSDFFALENKIRFAQTIAPVSKPHCKQNPPSSGNGGIYQTCSGITPGFMRVPHQDTQSPALSCADHRAGSWYPQPRDCE